MFNLFESFGRDALKETPSEEVLSEELHDDETPALETSESEKEETPEEKLESRYTRTVDGFARAFIYQDESIESLSNRIKRARENPDLSSIEGRRHEFGALLHLAEGVQSHEQANFLHGGAWQEALNAQRAITPKGHPPKPPETLTREEVEKEWDAFLLKKHMIEAEQLTIDHYEAALKLYPDFAIQVSEGITIERADIEVLLNDLYVRAAERISDTDKRKVEIDSLDLRLKTIIDELAEKEREIVEENRRRKAEAATRGEDKEDGNGIELIPNDTWGKRFELEEMFLLRRLIHTADTGHLVSVNHGTPREDLRRDHESVDMVITYAGRRSSFQIKTPNSNAPREQREKQEALIEKSKEKLRGSSTSLITLKSMDIQNAFEKASEIDTIRRQDARSAFQPLIDTLEKSGKPTANNTDESEADILVELLGVSEKHLEKERAQDTEEEKELQEKAREIMQSRAEASAKEEARKQAEAEAEAKQRVELERWEAEKRERAEAVAQKQREDAEKAEAERQKIRLEKEKAKAERKTEKDKNKRDLKRIVEEREKKEEAERKKEEAKQRKKERAQESKTAWPPKNFAGLLNASVLNRLGFLPQSWNSDQLVEAKKTFLRLFAKPSDKGLTDASMPSKLFKEIFPTRESLASPTEEDIERLREYLNQQERAA